MKIKQVPESWTCFAKSLSESEKIIDEGKADARRLRDRLKSKTAVFRKTYSQQDIGIEFPVETPAEIISLIRETINKIRDHQSSVIADLDLMAEDFAHAEINENRFVVLVFGAVNAGKSALANHVAGLDFDNIPAEFKAKCFVGDQGVRRLAEKPTECTKEYQGFKLPGIHWIDCPGVLSGTFRNSELARQLVGKADFVLFVSHSDAPFTESEMKELRELIIRSGNKHIDGCLVITKADEFIEDESHDGRQIRRVIKKSDKALQDQQKWCKEQRLSLKKSGLSSVLRMRDPIYTSVYMAREALGRNWVTGDYFRHPDNDWEAMYKDSGFPQLFELIGGTIQKEGASIKARWPKKREAAFQSVLDESTSRSLKELSALLKSIRAERSDFRSLEKDSGENAAASAGAAVKRCLEKHGIRKFKEFDRDAAENDLRKVLARAIRGATTKILKTKLELSRRRIDDAVDAYIAKTRFELNLRQKFKNRAYESTAAGRGWGKGIGGSAGTLSGAWAGAKIGVAIFGAGGPAGTIGGFIGGFIAGAVGTWLGGKVGASIKKKKMTERICVGTNSAEVISTSILMIEASARRGTARVFDVLDIAFFENLLLAVGKTRRQVYQWAKSL